MARRRESGRLPRRVLKRYADLVLRQIHQAGGRSRYVAVTEIEDALGLEQELVLELCRTRLRGEVHVAERPSAELEEGTEFHTALERVLIRACFAEPHVRIRPAASRLTEGELLAEARKKKQRKRAR